MDLKVLGKGAFWAAAVTGLFIAVVFGLFLGVSSPTLISGFALMPIGGAFVGALLATSFEHPEEE